MSKKAPASINTDETEDSSSPLTPEAHERLLPADFEITTNFDGKLAAGGENLRGARSRSLGVIQTDGIEGADTIDEATGIAQPQSATKDDLYIADLGLRRIFASEFLANLEEDARKLFSFEDADFEGYEGEETPLQPRALRQRLPSMRAQESVSRIIVTFLKSMVGSYVLYTPKIFFNGGIAAASLTLFIAAWVACDNMIVLIKCAEITGKNSFGQIGKQAFGQLGLLMVDVSLVLSQLSFCCTYFIFIVKNMPSVMPVPPPGSFSEFLLTADVLIALQLLVYIPMAWIRRLKYLALAMFVANICLWIGLVLITFIDIRTLVEDGPERVMLYNPDSYILCLGAVVVCFEGIGLVLPLRDSLDPPLQAKLPGIVQGAMLFLAVVYVIFACLGYLAFGEHVQTFVTMNIPKGDPVGTTSVALYSVAIILTYPLQLFPAVKCIERHVFGGGNRKTMQRTWLKNILRTTTVLFTAVVANYAGASFDNFAGLIGGMCAVPLALIYPSAFQLQLMGEKLSPLRRTWTWFVLWVGVLSTVVCTWQALSTWK